MAPTTVGQRPCDPCTVVIFGAAGDLTKRKLIPALHNLANYGLLPRQCSVVGVARRPIGDDEFRKKMAEDLETYATSQITKEEAQGFASRLYFVGGDIDDAATYAALRERLQEIQRKQGGPGNVLFYMATPPQAFGPIAQGLAQAGLSEESNGWRRVIIEKPFGHDLDSAVALNNDLRKVLRERQIFRIDHYLGKETVQNLLVFRFGNGVFEPVWNRRYIDHVQMTVGEELGVEGRGGYYDTAGVMRDMIQNHMFQLLALVAMEPPVSFQGEGVRNEKVKVLEAIRPMQPEEILKASVRGQYGEGTVRDGERVPGYRQEPGVPPSSKTETYAAIKLQVENWRWAGVPFYLRSGKRLARRATEIVITFRRPPLLLFNHTTVDELEPNRLVIRVQPDEGISMVVQAKRPGPSIALAPVKLSFSYKDFGAQVETTGYEQLLYDCMIGDATLFHRADMVEAAWRIATPILDLWASLPARDFPNYPAGSWGPVAADQLIEREGGRRWIQPE
jgi:glucose-6-phosphate 1-dehydrogenase